MGYLKFKVPLFQDGSSWKLVNHDEKKKKKRRKKKKKKLELFIFTLNSCQRVWLCKRFSMSVV